MRKNRASEDKDFLDIQALKDGRRYTKKERQRVKGKLHKARELQIDEMDDLGEVIEDEDKMNERVYTSLDFDLKELPPEQKTISVMIRYNTEGDAFIYDPAFPVDHESWLQIKQTIQEHYKRTFDCYLNK